MCQTTVTTMGKRPTLIRDYANLLTGHSAYLFCQYHAEEADFNGHDDLAKYWGDMAKGYKATYDLGIKEYTSSHIIEDEIKKDLDSWEACTLRWNDGFNVRKPRITGQTT